MELGTKLTEGEIYYWDGLKQVLFYLDGEANDDMPWNTNCFKAKSSNPEEWNSLHISHIHEATEEEKKLLKESGEEILTYKRS